MALKHNAFDKFADTFLTDYMDLMSRFYQTVRSMLNEPRQVIDSYLHGGSKDFMHPLLFCFIGAAIVIVLNTLFLDFSLEHVAGDLEGESEALRQLTYWTQIVSVRAATQFFPLSLIVLCIISLSAGAILFLRDKTNGFFDFLAINTYSIGASMVVLPLLIPVWAFSGQPLTDPFINSTFPAMVVAGIILWIYSLYFKPSGFLEWLRILSGYITGYVIYVLFSGFAASVLGYMIFAINRLSSL